MRKLTVQNLYWVLAVLLFLFMLFFTDALDSEANRLKAENKAEAFMGGWAGRDGKEADLRNLFRSESWYSSDGSVVINKTLPAKIRPESTVNFCTHNVYYDAYVNGVLMDSYHPKPNITGPGYGTSYHSIPLVTNQAQGKVITLKVYPAYPGYTGGWINQMYLCGGIEYQEIMLSEHGLSLIASLLLVFVGMIGMVAHFGFSRTGVGQNVDIFSLGFCVLLMGLWSSVETSMLQFFTGKAVLFRVLEYEALWMAPYAMIRFLFSLTRERRKIYPNLVFATFVAANAVCWGQRLLFRGDLHRTIFITHVLLMIAIVLIFIMTGSDYRYCRKKHIFYQNRTLISAVMVFTAACLLDLILYLVSKGNLVDSAFFMRLGLLFLSAVQFVSIMRMHQRYAKEAGEKEAMEQLVYRDALTGIGNRAAWKREESSIQARLEAGKLKDAMAVMMDLNNLKRCNDAFGHAKGDEFITRAAEAISEAFRGEGTCYRTGGDEFALFLTGSAMEERYQTCILQLWERLSRMNDNHETAMPLRIASGSARVGECLPKTIEAAEVLADNRMYLNKQKLKEKYGDFRPETV